MFKKNNKNYNAQSSESDISSQNQQENLRKYQDQHSEQSQDEQESDIQYQANELDDSLQKTNMDQKIYKVNHDDEQQQNSRSSQQEDSSDESGEAYIRKMQMKNGIHTIRQDPGEGLEDDSIDHIEQRIKRLENDLESRLNKHKEKQEVDKKELPAGKIVSKASALPPMPKKISTSSQQNQNKMNTINQMVNKYEQFIEKKPQLKKQTDIPNPLSNAKLQKQIKQIIPSFKQISKSENKYEEKDCKGKIKSRKQTVQKQQQRTYDIRIQEMQKIIKNLRLENQVLKQKLESQKSNNNSRTKNKAIKELQKMKDSSSINEKLEKQIELLEVIEKLQTKLKKSISKKLAAQAQTNPILNKRLPASMQSNY